MDHYCKIIKEINEIARKCHRSPEEIAVVAISKGSSLEEIVRIYGEGCRAFGENRIQEVLPKIVAAPQDIHWHFVGPLQQNKVKKAIGKFDLIHSVDSNELAYRLSLESQKGGVTTNILLQINTSGEMTKQGFTPSQCKAEFERIIGYPHLCVKGFMTMAPLTDNKTMIRDCFRQLRDLKCELAEATGYPLIHLSMGMSQDYAIAIEEGATLLRIGSAIFKN